MKKLLSAVLIGAFFVGAVGIAAATTKEKPDRGVKQKVFVHWPETHKGKKSPKPRPPKPPAGPACNVTGSDEAESFSLAGWYMPTLGMNYVINTSTAPKKTRAMIADVIDNSFQAWTNVDSAQIFTYNGETRIRTQKFDGKNVIAWKGIRSGAIAITYLWYTTDTGELIEADTVFNKNLPWVVNDPSLGDCGGNPSSYDIQNVATHEFGHWVGLGDLYASVDSGLTMYGYGALGELKKSSLGAGDILGVTTVAP